MDREERPAGVDRTDSYTKDKSYTPREARSHLQKRVAEGWKSNDRQVLRQDTSDFEPRRQNKRLRYTIPLRYRRVPPKDEEKGIKEDEGPNIGYLRPAALDRENSRGSLALALAEYLEIVSTQWVPDDESREIVTLTVKDSVPKPGQEQVRCESRWKHIQSEAPTFRLFYNQVERTPGLGPDDIALVARLLNTVQKTCEKHFVHGRFLKPVILVYDGEDPDEALGVQKTATFVGLPIFTTSFPYRHATGKDFEGHPVRALLQSRFRLDSTKRRDKEQVITKTSSSNGHIVHVPQIWALIINKSTVITCSPLPVSELRGETIKILSYSEAQQDEALWSIHFIDAQGKTFYLPLRYCKTWFGLVKHIADNCVQDEWNLVRDQLLKDGPIYKLVNDKDDSPITADLWPKLVEEKKKTEVIRLRLVDNEEVSNRLLVTYCDEDGNEISFESDASSETQSVFSGDGGESDASESSVSSMPTTFEEIGPAVERLRRLRFRLQEADERKHTKKAEELRDRRIPALEEQILNLTAQGLDLDPPVRERPRTSIVIPSPYEYRPRSMHAVYHDSPLSPISQYYSPRLRSRSRSDSRSRPRRSAGYSRSAYDLSMEEAYVRGRSGQPLTSPTIHRSISRPKHRSEAEYYLAPRTRSRPRSHMPSRPSISRTSTPNFPQSRWNLVRSRFRIGQTSGFDSTPVSPTTKKSEIYYKPSEKQLARSYWDLVRSSVLGGDIHKLRGMKATQAEAEITDAPRKHIKDADDRQTMGGAMLSSLNTTDETLKPKVTANVPKNDPAPSEVQEVPQHSTTTTLQSVGSQAKQKKKVLFSKQLHEGKPKLKRLITLAQMETSALPKPPTQQSTKDTTGTYENDKTLDSPIFLWSTDHQLPSADSPAPELWKTTDAVDTEEESRLGSLFQKNSDENKRLLGPSITEELILHTILAEVHSNLKKPKRGVEQYSILYENTTEKSLPEVMAAMKAIVGTNATDTKETSAGDASHITSSQDQLASVKLTIFDLACKILHAFIPKGHDAVVISKYWGALHKLLTENVRILRLPWRSRN